MACIIVDISLLVKTCQASISYPRCIVARAKIQGFGGIMIILNVYILQRKCKPYVLPKIYIVCKTGCIIGSAISLGSSYTLMYSLLLFVLYNFYLK